MHTQDNLVAARKNGEHTHAPNNKSRLLDEEDDFSIDSDSANNDTSSALNQSIFRTKNLFDNKNINLGLHSS